MARRNRVALVALLTAGAPVAAQTVRAPSTDVAAVRAALERPTQGAPLPADAADLDRLLATNDLTALTARLRNVNDGQQVALDLNWERAKVTAGAGFLIVYAYMYDLWRVGAAVPGPAADGIRQMAATMFVYANVLTSIDGLRCADVSAPGHRFDQLRAQNRDLARFLTTQPRAMRMTIGTLALAFERGTADRRGNDEVLCSGGLDQISAGLAAQGDKPMVEVPAPRHDRQDLCRADAAGLPHEIHRRGRVAAEAGGHARDAAGNADAAADRAGRCAAAGAAALAAALRCFRRRPQRLLGGEIEAGERRTRRRLHRREAPFELGVGAAQRDLGVDAVVAEQVDDGEQQVAALVEALGVGRRCGELRQFLGDLGPRTLGVGPVEAGPGGAALELVGAHQRRQGERHPAQRAGARLLGRLDALPVGGFGRVTEDVGMAALHLVGNGPGDVGQ